MTDEGPEIKRPDLYVLARFLERLWTSGKPMKKTRLQMAVGLNYGTFKKYLNWMRDKGLVSIKSDEEGSDQVQLTRKGVDSYDRIVIWISTMMPEEI